MIDRRIAPDSYPLDLSSTSIPHTTPGPKQLCLLFRRPRPHNATICPDWLSYQSVKMSVVRKVCQLLR